MPFMLKSICNLAIQINQILKLKLSNMNYKIKQITKNYEFTAEGGYCDYPITTITTIGEFKAKSKREIYNMIRKKYDSKAIFRGSATNWIVYDENEMFEMGIN